MIEENYEDIAGTGMDNLKVVLKEHNKKKSDEVSSPNA